MQHTYAKPEACHLRSPLAALDSSFRTRPSLWILALLTAGFIVRVWHAYGTFLIPDEAMHFAAANQPSWWLTYQESLDLAHPPLLIFLLHIWRHLGTSELMLRMPSILAGTAFCWLTFRWMAMLFTEGAAWAAFVLTVFLPSCVSLSAEVRQYALLLAFLAAAAYLLERALAQRSATKMLFSCVCLWLAFLTHFSAALFATALGAYAAWRMLKDRPPFRLFVVWAFGQIAAIGICGFLYVTQVSHLEKVFRGFSMTQGFMRDAYLAKYYFAPGAMNPVAFFFVRTGGFFQYAFHQLVIGDLAFLLFVAGAILIFARPRSETSRQSGFLLVFPFALNGIAALLHLYPYGGTRHCASLLPFAIAGIGAALAWICRERVAATVIVAGVTTALCLLFPSRPFIDAPPGAQSVTNMTAAMSFLRQVPRSEPIFADGEAAFLLGHYLCEQRPVTRNDSRPWFFTFECADHKVFVTRRQYILTAQNFPAAWQDMLQQDKLAPGDRVWVALVGADRHLETSFDESSKIEQHDSGAELHILGLTVGQSQAITPGT